MIKKKTKYAFVLTRPLLAAAAAIVLCGFFAYIIDDYSETQQTVTYRVTWCQVKDTPPLFLQ